jgi:hypothetical protein
MNRVKISDGTHTVTVQDSGETPENLAMIARALWDHIKVTPAEPEKPLASGTGFQVERSGTTEYVSDHQGDVRA